MLACTTGIPGVEFPLTLVGDGVVARVTAERGCQGSGVHVGLWGPGFGTDGDVVASMVQEEEDEAFWLHFPVKTGLGEAVAAMRLQGSVAVLPLGSRPGEFEVHLARTDMDDASLEKHASDSAAQLAKEVEYWKQGSFLLVSERGPVGEVRFRGDQGPIVSVHDEWWLTPRPVESTLESAGAELLVTFEAEPSLKGEGARMRIHVPSRTVVVPMGPVPIEGERSFRLEPGSLTDEARKEAMTEAISSADQLEQAFVQSLAPKLSAAASVQEGKCLQLPQMAEEWSMMLEGYDVQLIPTSQGCSVGIEPSRPQHGRRYRGVIQP